MSEAEDIFQQLMSAKWRDIEFPVTRMRASIAHDLVEHKYWGVDGARVESTGLAPWRYSFSIPLINGLTAGRAERWSDLYPNQMRRLSEAFQKKEKGMLQHPEFGLVLCKAERFDMDWDAGRRGGVDGEISFVETTEADVELREQTPVQVVDIGAAELDSAAIKADLKAILLAKGLDLPPYLQTSVFSFSEAMNKVKAIKDYPDLMERRASGQIAAIVYHAERAGISASSARSARTWPVTNNVEKIKAASHELKQNLIAGRRNVAFFTVPMDTTLAGVARQIPEAKVGDLVRLNPDLMVRPEITKGTVVRYYAPSRRRAA